MPTVEPIQVPSQPCCVASVIVASMVLSPSSARKNATVTAMMAFLVVRLAFSASSSVSSSPRSVHAAKPRKASPATTEMAVVGSASPISPPTATLTRWTAVVAMVMPASTGHVLKRVANVIAMSWLLSPSSATKITARLIQNASNGPLPRDRTVSAHPGRSSGTASARQRLRTRLPGRRSRPPVKARATGRANAPACRSRDWDYSPSVFPDNPNSRPPTPIPLPSRLVTPHSAQPTITGSLTSVTPNFSCTPSRTCLARASRSAVVPDRRGWSGRGCAWWRCGPGRARSPWGSRPARSARRPAP